jgi:hypothetical protein
MHAHTLPNRGKTFLTGSPDRTIDATMKVDLEGSIKHFDDVDPTVTSGAKMRRSNKRVVCMLVRNEMANSAVVLPQRVVKWKSGQRNRQIDGYCALTNEACAGVVDEFLTSAGAALHDLFWITVQGPTLMLNALAANTIALDDLLGALTAVTSGATTAGRVGVVALTATSTATTDGSFGAALANMFGRAMSSTATTNASILVDTFFLKS